MARSHLLKALKPARMVGRHGRSGTNSDSRSRSRSRSRTGTRTRSRG